MKRISRALFIILFIWLASAAARAEAPLSFCINELCSSNGGSYMKGSAAPDYIELRNLTDQALSLDGFFLSDDEDHPDKFSLEGYVLPENGYLILAADKKELPFKLSASDGEELFLSDGRKNILQHVVLPPLEEDTTYSLQQSGEWQIAAPTPLAENAEGTPYVKKVYVASPRFSHEAGFYDDPFDLTIESYKTYQVYYTTDGSIPDENSRLYSGPIHIEDATSRPNTLSMRTDITIDGATPPDGQVKKATIIRAVAIDAEGNRSNVETNTYFVGFQNYKAYQNIPVISIVAEPDDLFDEQDGIYVRGKVYQEWLEYNSNNQKELANRDIPTNYRQRGIEWEIPVSLQEFDASGSILFTQNVGLRVHGSSTRERVQKSFNLYARGVYGAKEFQYDMVPETAKREKYVVRINAGRDAIVHELLKDIGLPTSRSQPCLCFLNGEFWGFYELREKQDEEYIADFYGLNQNDLIVVKNGHINAGEIIAEEIGYNTADTRSIARKLDSFFAGLDTSTPEGYRAAEETIDIDNYLTYIVGNLYFNNGDFLNNDTFWRTASVNDEAYHDGHWRWIFQDMDQCFSSYIYKDTLGMVLDKPIFSSLWNNDSFRTKFYTMIMDFANVLFTTESAQDYVTELLAYYDGYYQITNERYMKTGSDGDSAKNLRASILKFLNNRRDELILQFSESFSDRRETFALTVNEVPSEVQLCVNGYKAYQGTASWQGIYFSGCEVTFEVGKLPGYKFMGWYENGELLTDQPVVTVSTDEEHSLTPVYELLPDIAVMDEINYARSNYRDGYVLYKRNMRSDCVIIPDAELNSFADFTAISIYSDDEWKKGTGFKATFPTKELSSCGMILYLTVPEGCPDQWNLMYQAGDEEQTAIDCTTITTEEGLRFDFELPSACMGLEEVSVHFGSAEDYPGGAVQITQIRLYGEYADEDSGNQVF